MVSENSQMYTGDGRRRNPDVIYFRNKKGWITWGDTQASKQLDKIRKGSVPLPQYGRITHSEDIWGPILRHPDGPAEFPVEQVLAYRWYDRRRLPDIRPIIQVGREEQRQGAQPAVIRFPQLVGVKITEYPCPESCLITLPDGKSVDKAYHDPVHLGNHLRVMHGYDRSEIIKYGDAMGIDFTKVPGGKELVTYEFDEVADEVRQDAEEAFEVERVAAPKRQKATA